MVYNQKVWGGWSPLKQVKNPTKPKERVGRVYVGDMKMSTEPMYEGQKESSHIMADDGEKTAWPTLFQVDGVWHDTSKESTERQMEIAKQQGELYEFDTHDKMVGFARHGNWKNK